VHLHFDALNVLRISNYNQYLIFPFRGAIAAGLYGYNGILVGLLMAVFSNAEDWYWWPDGGFLKCRRLVLVAASSQYLHVNGMVSSSLCSSIHLWLI